MDSVICLLPPISLLLYCIFEDEYNMFSQYLELLHKISVVDQ